MDNGPGLVQRFAAFAINLINNKMEPFFAEKMHLFDQDVAEALRTGETLQQYEAFKEYEIILERELEDFVHKEDYNNPAVFLKEIQRLVDEDKVRVKKMLEAMLAQLQNMIAQAMGVPVSEVQGDNGPQAIMFQPAGLEELLNTVMSLTEYTTFRALMRARVAQDKLRQLVLDMTRLMAPPPPITENDIEVEEYNDADEDDLIDFDDDNDRDHRPARRDSSSREDRDRYRRSDRDEERKDDRRQFDFSDSEDDVI